MRKLWLVMVCALVLLGTATVSEAKMFVTISDGTTTLDARAAAAPFVRGNLELSKTSAAPLPTAGNVTDTLNIVRCTPPAVRPCTVFFPSGAPTQQAGDTFKIQDVGATATLTARLEKLDSATSADRVSFKGVKITSIAAGRILTIIYGTETGDLRVLTSAQAASYFASAAFSGSFKTNGGLGTRATACKLGTLATDMDQAIEACVRLSIALNGTTVDGQGSSVSTTVAVPCNNAFPTVNPCGANGSWVGTTGTFTGVNDGRSIACPANCSPSQVATLTGRFNGINETLQLTASLNGVISNVPDQEGGIEEVALTLADETGLNRWVTTDTASRFKAVPLTPMNKATRNDVKISTTLFPLKFEYWCGSFVPAGLNGITMVSLADTPLLPGAAGARYMASRETFLADGLTLGGLTTLSFSYDVFTGTETTPIDARLDAPLTYVDCKDGSIRVEIQLVDTLGDGGTLKVYLGSTTGPPSLTPPNSYRSGCDGAEAAVGSDIVGNPDPRVDGSDLRADLKALLTNPCCSTFTEVKTALGTVGVRKIAFVVSRPVSPVSDPDENYRVKFLDASVNGVTAASSLLVPSGNFVRVIPTSTTGVSITITKLTGANAGVVKVIPSSGITIEGGRFKAVTSFNNIQAESGANYSVALCPDGSSEAETDPTLPANTVTGNCIADQGRFTLH
jgi:hypothetical protein